ncbi:uncharacterized protein LOC143378276 [Andrena cerasifolii]|uniref:uncharacterized protein LOC143378276 n=1 Tax=Andrena cerasifolii TaxID=2819439 RepID=UPI004037F553
MTVDRLDEQSCREWEASLGLCTDPPSLDALRVFIETRIHTFKVQDAATKKATVAKLQRCLNCLGKHQIDSYQSNKRCQRCAEQHHSCLHDAFPTAAGAVVQHVTPRVFNTPPVMLGLARRQRARIPLLFAGGAPSQCTRGLVHLDITADRDSESILALSAFVLIDLSSYKPPVVHDGTIWPHLQGLQWAEPRLANQDPIDLLLGADVYTDFMLEGVRKGKPGTPLAQETTFGWILTGGLRNGCARSRKSVSTVQCCSINQELPGLLEKFWEQEEVQITPTLSPGDQEAEDHFQATHRRTSEGRFVVRLPFKVTPELGPSRPAALRTLNSMQQRFRKNPEYERAYQDFLQEYEDLGHMVAARAPPPEGRHFYLPHHGVLKATSTTTKLRVVFNGSMNTTNGRSLNDVLHTGPNLLPALADLLLRWRRHPIVFVADVEKMYRQIIIHPDDRDYQRIPWRKGKELKLREYKLCTVTYGLGCAPYLALRCLRQLAADEAELFPLASKTMCSDVYVDVILTGATSVEEALTLKKELDQLAMAGGFRLHKWASNSPEFMRSVHNDVAALARHWDTDTQHSVLGIQWLPATDNFQIRLLEGSTSPTTTKRSVLSQAAQIFDPLGWLAPVTVWTKIFIQTLWTLTTDWDEALPVQSEDAWREFLKALPALRQIQIPRCMGLTSTNQSVEVHGFSDASERAYSAVAYLRVHDSSGDIQIHLISAKTKVAPLKKLSLPRLELSGAHLLTRLVAHLLSTLALRINGVHLWTDALVALGWIQAPSSRWQTYVANRVADIQRTLPQAHWHHVSGQDNPADCASRGLTPAELPEHPLWWSGPSWLATSEGRPVTFEEPIEVPHSERRHILHVQRSPEDESPTAA